MNNETREERIKRVREECWREAEAMAAERNVIGQRKEWVRKGDGREW